MTQALRRADQIEVAEGNVTRDWYAPIVADAEAGFGGPLNAYEMMKVHLVSCKITVVLLLRIPCCIAMFRRCLHPRLACKQLQHLERC